MSHRGKIKRYLLVLERLDRPTTFNQLKEHLSDDGFALSPRTLQRDLADLRDEFGVDVRYDRTTGTYSLDKEGDGVSTVIQLLERAQLLEIVNGSGNDLRDLHQQIRFERLGRLQGIHHLAELLKAIRRKREVSVFYRKFRDTSPKMIRLRPHLLKEFHGRWYVLGPTAGSARPIALGLDRIDALEIHQTRFVRNDKAMSALYDHAIGVDTSPGRAERIVLHFDPTQAPYIRTLPLHHSQTVVSEDRHGTTFALFVMPNFELFQLLLGFGASVRVLEPKTLAASIEQAHLDAVKRYRA